MDILGDAENPPFVVLRVPPTICVKSGFEKMLVFPEISRMDILGDAENPTFYTAQL